MDKKQINGKWIPLIVGCSVTLGVCIIMIIQAILTRRKLLLAKSTCKENILHLFIDGQVDDINVAMECVCCALDNAKCPNFLQFHILIPISYPDEVTAWDSELVSLCTSKPNYNTFFKENVHFYKYNIRKRKSLLHHMASLLEELESVDSYIVLLPTLTKLVYGWDEKIRNDLLIMSSDILVYPLLKSEESYFIESIPRPGFFSICPDTLGFTVKQFHIAKQSFSLGLSLRHPIITSKSVWLRLKNAPSEDLALTSYCINLDFIIVHGAQGIGHSLYKNTTNKVRASNELKLYSTPKSLFYLSMDYLNSFTVYAKSILGIHIYDTLEEKILKYGYEAKYQSAKHSVLF